VPPDDPRSNHRMVRETLLEGIAPAPVIPARPPPELPPPEAAASYARLLRRDFLLRELRAPAVRPDPARIGDDGHTASLFPGMPALDEKHRLVVATEVPAYVRPFVSRITLTLPVLNAAEHVMFLVEGQARPPPWRPPWTGFPPGTAARPTRPAAVRADHLAAGTGRRRQILR